jgi:hypothetical protein
MENYRVGSKVSVARDGVFNEELADADSERQLDQKCLESCNFFNDKNIALKHEETRNLT